MRIVDAARFFFRDENWVHNALIGTVYTLIPVVGPIALAGWHCEIAQRLVRKDPVPIPRLELGALGDLLTRGIAPFIAQLIVIMPMALVFGLGMGIGGAALALLGAQSPAAGIALLVLVGVVSIAFALLMMVASSTTMTRAELTEDLSKTLDFGALMAYGRATFGLSLGAWTVYALVCIPLGLLGMAACCVGIYPMSVALNTGAVHLRVQIYERYLEQGGAAMTRATAGVRVRASIPAGMRPLEGPKR